MPNITIDGIVAMRDKQPYVRLFVDGKQAAQLSISEARKIAMDLLQMSSRTEADAILHAFFKREGLPEGAGVALMMQFREFRLALDTETVEGFHTSPEPEAPKQ